MALIDHISYNWSRLKKKTKTDSKVTKKKVKTKDSKDSTKSILNKITSDLDKSKKAPKNKSNLDADALSKWAEDNDIPLEDVNKAYDLPSGNVIEKALSSNQKQIGKFLAMDCEFVGVGLEGAESALARVSIVNFHGHTVYDKFVKPREKVTDWRTWVSGVTPAHMKEAIDFKTAQQEVADLLNDRVLVGHAIEHDLEALLLSHPKSMIRDTSKHQPFKKLAKGKTPGLKKLAKQLLNIDIQGAEHSSVEDARATMLLYKFDKKEFEKAHQRFKERT